MRYLLLVVFLSACGKPQICEDALVDFDVNGLKVCTNGLDVDPTEVDHIMSLIRDKTKFSKMYQKFENSDTRIEFVSPDKEICYRYTEYKGNIRVCETRTEGLTLDCTRSLVEYDPCLGLSSLGHELLHMVDCLKYGRPSEKQAHSRYRYFYEVYGYDSIEIEVRDESACYPE